MPGNHRSGRRKGSKNKKSLVKKVSDRLSKKSLPVESEKALPVESKVPAVSPSVVEDLFKSRLGTVGEEVFNSRFKRVVDKLEERLTVIDGDEWLREYYFNVIKPFKDVSHDYSEEGGLDKMKVEEFWAQEITSPWIYAPDPVVFNSAEDTKNEPVLLATFMVQDVFVWFPALQFGKEGYPHCRYCCKNTSETIRFKDWTEKRMVYCQSRTILLLTVRYQCRDCKATFNCFNADVLRQYPPHIRESFPFLLTHKKGVHNDVAEELASGKMTGESVKAFCEKLLGQHKTAYY